MTYAPFSYIWSRPYGITYALPLPSGRALVSHVRRYILFQPRYLVQLIDRGKRKQIFGRRALIHHIFPP